MLNYNFKRITIKGQEKVAFEYLSKAAFSHFLYRGEKALDAVL